MTRSGKGEGEGAEETFFLVSFYCFGKIGGGGLAPRPLTAKPIYLHNKDLGTRLDT